MVSAIAASKRELKTVLIIEGSQETEHRDAGYAFPIDPAPLSGFGHEQTVLRLFRELRISLDESPRMILMDPAFQVILPSHRVDLFHDHKRLIDEMIREFPQQEQEIKRIYGAIHKANVLVEHWIGDDVSRNSCDFQVMLRKLVRLPAAIAARSSLVIRENGYDYAVRRVIEAQIALLSHLDMCSGHPLPLSAAHLLSLPTNGVFYPTGGRSVWLNWLRKVFTDSGGTLINGCSVMRMDTKQDITLDLQYAGSSSTIHGKKLIVSANWEKLNLLLFHEKVFRRLMSRLGSNHPTAYPFSLHLGIHEGGLPESMAPYTAVVTDEKVPAMGRNVILVERSLAGETSRAPEGRRAISATIFLKDSPLLLDDAKLKGIANAIIDSLDGFLPFLRESIDYVNVEKSITLARQSQEIVNKKYSMPKRPILGIHALSQRTPLSNVLLTGGIFWAGLGFEGEMLSGVNAVMVGQEAVSYAE